MSSILSGHESFDTKLWKFQFAYQTSYDTHVDDEFIKKNTINLSRLKLLYWFPLI